MADYVFTQADPDGYFIEKAQIVYGVWNGNTPPDTRKLKNAGDYENLEIEYEIEESELEMNTSIARTIARTDVTKKAGTFSMGVKQMSDFWRRVQYLAAEEKIILQEASVAHTIELDEIEIGDIISTGFINIGNVSIEDELGGEEIGGEPVGATYESGLHLNVDSATGMIEVIGIPDDASGSGVLTFDVPEVTADNKRKEFGLMTGQGVDLRIEVRQLHGTGDHIVLPKVRFRVDGSLVLGKSDTEYGNVPTVGKILADVTQPADRAMGYARTLKDHAA